MSRQLCFLIFWIVEKKLKQWRLFAIQTNTKISTSKLHRFFTHRNYIEQSTSKRPLNFFHQNYAAKITSKRSQFPSLKLHRKSSSKRHDFLHTEITSKKYIKTTWKFVEILFLTYRRNIDIKSTLIQHVVSDGCSKTNFISNIERVSANRLTSISPAIISP